MIDSSLVPAFSPIKMSTPTRIVNAVASSSRRPSGARVSCLSTVISRQRHSATVKSSRSVADPDPPPPLSNKGKRREDIRYSIGTTVHSNERVAYSQRLEGAEDGELELGADWVISGHEDVEGISPGRVVEARRWVSASWTRVLKSSIDTNIQQRNRRSGFGTILHPDSRSTANTCSRAVRGNLAGITTGRSIRHALVVNLGGSDSSMLVTGTIGQLETGHRVVPRGG